jgi:MFS family permease
MANEVERKLISRAAVRLVPFLMFTYFVSYIDRVNIGFASFQMEKAVHITPSILGLGGGLYFISYVLFEVPSNLMISRQGVKRFLTTIMLLWGAIACGMALVPGPRSFLVMRFLLGAAEAGVFPGVILYLTYWFPKFYRGKVMGWFTLAIPLSSMIGSPISAALLQMDKILGLGGWQWLFIVEGVPALILGIVCPLYISDGPHDARWLGAEERQIYESMLARERTPDELQSVHVPLWRVLIDPKVLGLGVVLAASSATSNTFAVWSPRFIRSFHVSDMTAGWLNAGPFLLGAVAIIAGGYHSDRKNERIWHAAAPLLCSAVCTALLLVAPKFAPSYVLLTITVMGIYAAKAPIWAVSTEWLPDEMKAVGIAQINAVSSLISFFPIYTVGLIREAHGSFGLAFLPMAFISAAGAGLLLLMNRRRQVAIVHTSSQTSAH